MEFRDLKTQYLRNKKQIDSAIQKTLMDGHFIGGDPVHQLEEDLANYVGVKYCITCANGTDALQLALMAWGVGEGDAVFVPDFTFFSTAEVVSWVGATPVFVDIHEDTFNISSSSLEDRIQEIIREGRWKPKAVIAVDLFGQPADFPAIRTIVQKYDLLLLEDGAQGFGGRIGKKKACSFGDISTTSFFPAKPLGCYGDGGAVFTDNDEWAKLMASYKVHGKGENKYDNVRIGMNSRLDTLQAAILQVKFAAFKNYELNAVNLVAEWYNDKLGKTGVKCPQILKGFYSSWAQYTIQLESSKERNSLIGYLKEKGVPSAVYYQKPMHMQKVFEELAWRDELYPGSNHVSERVLSLPMHPYLEEAEVSYVCELIKDKV